LLEGAEAIARGKSDRQLLAKVLNTKGWLADFNQEWELGIQSLNEAIDVAPDNVERAIAHRLLGHLYAQSGTDMQAAREHYTQSAALTRDPVDTFSAHQGLFLCDRAANDLDGAERHLLASSAIAEENGLMLGMAFVHENIAILAASRGHWEAVLPALHKALALHEVLGPKSPPADLARSQLTRAYIINDECELARQIFDGLPPEIQTAMPDVQAFLMLAENKDINVELRAALAAMPAGEPLSDAVLSKIAQH
jgi:tetratricopeptide (TPR) repeat protein